MRARGFILQAGYRILTGRDGERVSVMHVYGKLEDGATFLVRDDRSKPTFYIRAADAERARALRTPEPRLTEKRTFDGAPVCKIETETPPDVPAVRDRLHAEGIETFEADVRFGVRYLIERGIKGSCEIEGDAAPRMGVDWVFENPELRPADLEITARVLSFDIETDAKAERLLAISLYSTGDAPMPPGGGASSHQVSGASGSHFREPVDEVLIVDAAEREMPERATRYATEFAALDAFCERVRAFDPDVLTGWNTIDFDFTVLQRIAQRVRHPFNLGRGAGALRVRKAEGYFGSGQATVPGRLVLDGIDLLRGAFVRMEEYSLDAVAREVLGEGKAVSGDVRDRVGEIMHNYQHDLPAFALYARTDARLAYEIVQKLNLVRLSFARSRLTGMTPDRVAASIASFDFLYLSELERRGIVAPTVRGGDSRVHAAQQGGHVLEPIAGLHRNVWVFDFKSLYPSIIRTFNIDPLSYVQDAPAAAPSEDDGLIHTPGGAFSREKAILPGMLDDLFPQREAAKKAGDEVASNAIKILMNSFYGVLGTSACRFYNPALANSITGTGREMLLWSKRWFEQAGYTVLYGDTDSLFVSSGMQNAEADAAVELGRELAQRLNGEIAEYIESRWKVPSRLELKFEKLYLKLFLSRARHSERGASKRYAGLRHSALTRQRADVSTAGDEPNVTTDDYLANDIEFVGLEVVRRDWTALAKQVQRELYQRLFTDRPVDVYLAEVVRRVRSGELDDALVYRKNLRKGTTEYTATTPPHVAAARKSTQALGRSISYVVTTAGPEPLDNVLHPIDREHYVVKQIKPVAEPVLETLGLVFEKVIGDARQLDMLAMLEPPR